MTAPGPLPRSSTAPDRPTAILAGLFVIAQLADLLSALVVARELNPIVAALGSSPVAAIAVKLVLIGFVLAVVRIAAPTRPLVAPLVLVIGIVAGAFGALSNTHLTPFWV
jgi:hypothetical protein